ncbi:hypothetical protein CVT24_007724 [Panaeolus cyanescens]|uniref:MYND-type domain-containing protein n=1 Tax=Panaeolus cyanescens TaxID=181874 RepID=A0A409VR92_9AGAR|nr:hypothetical protein CVT24_007724 [Panaeolus cyanescens]
MPDTDPRNEPWSPWTTYPDRVIDLHELGVLINYERASTDHRFRHIKLREVATISDFTTIKCSAIEWTTSPNHRLGLVYDKRPAQPAGDNENPEPDLITNMVNDPIPPLLRHLTTRDLETFYWRTRHHDASQVTAVILQHFFDLFPPYTRVRIRTMAPVIPSTRQLQPVSPRDAPINPPKHIYYSTLVSDRKVIEFQITNPKQRTVIAVLPGSKPFITGGYGPIKHTILGFGPPASPIETVYDLTSMQFGEEGKGNKRKGLFVLEPIQDYVGIRLPKMVESHTMSEAKLLDRVEFDVNDIHLIDVARRVKTRWQRRKEIPFCAYCGAPPEHGKDMAKCSACKLDHYCNEEHQRNAWPFHKLFCDPTNRY